MYLTQEEIQKLVKIGIDHDFHNNRKLLFAFTKIGSGSLKVDNMPIIQLLGDLTSLNQMNPSIENGVPLKDWLKMALFLLKEKNHVDYKYVESVLNKLNAKLNTIGESRDSEIGDVKFSEPIQNLYELIKQANVGEWTLRDCFNNISGRQLSFSPSVTEVFDNLNQMEQEESYYEILTFVEKIRRQMEKSEHSVTLALASWMKRYEIEWNITGTVEDLRRKNFVPERRTVIAIRPNPEVENHYFVSFWMAEVGKFVADIESEREQLLNKIQAKLNEKISLFEKMQLECFIPSELIYELAHIDKIKLIHKTRYGSQLLHPISSRGVVYLRSYERQRDKGFRDFIHPSWKEKWDTLESEQLPLGRINELLKSSNDTHVVVLDNSDSKKLIENYRAQLNDGTPVIIWGGDVGTAHFPAFVEEFSRAIQTHYKRLDQRLRAETLCQCIYQLRRYAHNFGSDAHLGNHVVLFLDNPYDGLPINL